MYHSAQDCQWKEEENEEIFRINGGTKPWMVIECEWA
jgi:hypothetical protein